MHRADKAVLRLGVGLGLAVLIAYGFAMQAPYLVCAATVLVLCSPGPPIPFLKGAVVAAVIAALLLAGVLMVPLLENYAASGVVLTGAMLYAVFFAGARSPNPMTIFLVIALTLIPVAGVVDQHLATVLSQGMGIGLGIGFLMKSVTHTLFPDMPVPGQAAAAAASISPGAASWSALQATLIVMPAFVLALTDPKFYLSTIMKSVTMGEQAGATNAHSAGRELVGSTLLGALLATVVWCGLSVLPNLWMLMLWIVAAALWVGARLFRVRSTSEPPSYWLNVLITMFVLLGPAIEDSANGKDVYDASAMRVALFVLVALYGWATVWGLERWRASRSRSGSGTQTGTNTKNNNR